MAEKWIFDTDGGVDDTYGIMLALSQPAKFDVVAFTTVAGNVPAEIATLSVSRTMEICKVKRPIYVGADQGIVEPPHIIFEVHGFNGQGDAPEYKDLVGYTDCIHRDKTAAEAIVDLVNANPGQLSLLATGPLTNIALAVKLDPSIAGKVKRLVAMGGSHFGQGNTSWATEFNFHCDPEAASICIEKMPFAEIITKEEGDDFIVAPEDEVKWLNPATPKGRFLQCITKHMVQSFKRIYIYDAIAVAIAMDAGVTEEDVSAACKIELHGADTRGVLAIDWHHKSSGPKSRVVLRVKYDAVMKMLIDSTAAIASQ